MKTEEQIRAAFDPLLRAAIGLMQSERSEEVRHIGELTSRLCDVLAWVLDERTYPGYERVNRLVMRMIAIDDQHFTSEVDAEGAG